MNVTTLCAYWDTVQQANFSKSTFPGMKNVQIKIDLRILRLVQGYKACH